MPGSPSIGRLGIALTRQRVAAATGASRSASAHVLVRQRRSTKAVTPEDAAASCSRRLAVSGNTPTSPTTAARADTLSPSSIASSTVRSSRPRTERIRCGARPRAARPGP